MAEIASLEEVLVLAAADADSRQYGEQIVAQREQDNNKCDKEIVNNVLNVGTKRKSDRDINGSISKCVLIASIDKTSEHVTNKGCKRKREGEDDSNKYADGYAKIVASHYNQIEEKGLDERSKSRIVYLRNFHNWIKSMLINEYLTKIKDGKKYNAPIRVHDMCCGKGGDLQKWKKGGITHLICSDIASVSLDQCKDRYTDIKNRRSKDRGGGNIYSIEYIPGDCSRMRLRKKYSDPSMKLDLVSCQFAFHYGFESLPQAECMLRNASECLQPGGYFIGTIPDAYELIARAKRNDSNTYGNNVYTVTLDFDLNKPPLFGAKYNFHLDGVVDCPEFLVHFPMLVKLAKKFGLKLIKTEKFLNLFERMKSEGRQLLGNMRSLEAYPPFDSAATLVGTDPNDYVHASKFIKTAGKNNLHIGTLSKSEWEASCKLI
ncbi:hypothetical protein NQ314_007212 [Rhamnusium bicolor]|uniref:mRNA cap guanine-N(7) methyltransferase n=1 Tax=Rhamnusium bicolor TaxID=1586634 RepID=A0AAV8YQF3_9CUCU|nr:hypothetical protein NQ314_007212 [Rhamnusium bicolor]